MNYAPETISTGKYTSEMCEWLASRGHKVRVIAAPPYYPAWKTWPEYRGFLFRREWIKGVEVIRCPIWVPKVPTGLARVIHLGTFGITSAFALIFSLKWKPDWVINIAPAMSSAIGAWALARSVSAHCWLHLQDFEVDAAIELRMIKAPVLKKGLKAVERLIVQRFDVVSSITPIMVSRLKSKGVRKSTAVLFRNWANIGLPRSENGRGTCSFREALKIPANGIVALYSGNMGLKQGLELLSEAARTFSAKSNLYFVFAGEGPARQALLNECASFDNVRFSDLQPSERLSEWLAFPDIHLLPQRDDVADLVMPSKLTGMMASGKPILATAHKGTSLAIAVEGCGLVADPGNSQDFMRKLERLSFDHQLRKQYGLNARAYAERELSKEKILMEFESRLISDDA